MKSSISLLFFSFIFYVFSRVGDDGRKKGYVPDDDVDAKQEFRKPRDTLLFISSEFFSNCHFRLRELRKKKADPSLRPADKPPELFDSKTHNVSEELGMKFI